MVSIGALSFVAPWALLGLLALPALWWLLRIIPPAPRRVQFPAIRLIMRLVNPEESSAKTPLWLALLRFALVAAVIIAASHPVLNATDRVEGDGPLILAIDDGWSSARNWEDRRDTMTALIDQAAREGRAAGLITTARQSGGGQISVSLLPAAEAKERALALQPKPWPVDRTAAIALVDAVQSSGDAQVVWLSNGLDMGNADAFAEALGKLGTLSVLADLPGDLPTIMLPPKADSQGLGLTIRRAATSAPDNLVVRARDEDGRVLARREVSYGAGETETELRLDFPVEIRNRLDQLEIEGENHAGAVVLMDERWRRRPVGLVSASERRNDQPLLDDAFYLDRALAPFTEVRNGAVADLLKRELSLIVLADPGRLADADRQSLIRWMENGGVVVRFAGPRLAGEREPLLPVRLRKGDRKLGGALSWTRPARMAAFPETSPFHGIGIPNDVVVRRQVLAQPSVDLPDKTWARLADGTPLVTAEKQENGWLVFVHTTADPKWSTLALSGLFVEMMQQLVQLGRGIAADGEDRMLAPLRSVNGFGRIIAPLPGAQAIPATDILSARPGPGSPPGFYGDETSRRALNLSPVLPVPAPMGGLGAGIEPQPYQESRETDIRPIVLTLALLLALADIIASMALRGLFTFNRAAAAAAVLLAAVIMPPVNPPAQAQTLADGESPFDAALRVRLAYVPTGDGTIDDTVLAGLRGLSLVANSRTAAELAEPMAIDPASDELAFFPLIYWPVAENSETIPPEVAARVNAYLKRGGTILFDTRDEGGANFVGQRLQVMGRHLDIPPLTQVPPNHVLTRSYYLLRDFPGRWTGGRVWVERDGSRANDGVSSVIVGSHDWAGAWAIDQTRRPLYPVVPGGERQREMSYRFGINMLMYALTGNYKADQVHLPAILERLGQ